MRLGLPFYIYIESAEQINNKFKPEVKLSIP